MFGDNDMFFNTSVMVDYKNRLHLPARVNAEKGDEIVVLDKKDYHELVRKEEVVKELEKLRDLYLSTLNQEYMDLYEEYIAMIEQEVRVTEKGRINMNGILEPNKSYKVVGVLKTIRVYSL